MSLRLKHNNAFTLTIIYKYNGYSKAIIATHPDNSFVKVVPTTEAEYLTYGIIYNYDGNAIALDKLIRGFDVNSDNVSFLKDCLKTHFNLSKQRSYWCTVRDFVRNLFTCYVRIPVDEGCDIKYLT